MTDDLLVRRTPRWPLPPLNPSAYSEDEKGGTVACHRLESDSRARQCIRLPRTYDRQAHDQAVRELHQTDRLLDRLAALTAAPPSPQEQYDHRKVAGSPTPWNDRYAMLSLEVQAGARRLERLLRSELGLPVRRRPPTWEHALAALAATVDLAAALDGQERGCELPREAEAWTAAWARRARAVLDEERPSEAPWTRCPGGLRCHLCGSPLWLQPGWADTPEGVNHAPVFCRRCTDDSGAMISYPSAVWARMVMDDTPAEAG